MNSLCKSSPSTMVDEVHWDGEGPLSAEAVTDPINSACIKVIGPCHPTLVSSDINSLNRLPYTRREDAFLTFADSAPCTYKEVLKAPDKELWLAAINKELNSMEKLQVWEVVEQHNNFKLVRTTWVFRLKKGHSNGAIKHKARLCAQGSTQTQGIDFEKTYAQTAHLNSLQTLIAFEAAKGLKFHQIEIKSSFWNAPLLEEVYLQIPQDLELNERRWCLRLNKAIYRLKQDPLAWYKFLKEWLVGAHFQACILDPCVFYWAGIKPIWLHLHVNDITVFGNEISEFKEEISSKFEIKDLGTANLLLGVKITQEEDCIYLDQKHFCELLLSQYGMSECKPTCTPLVPKEQLLVETQEEIEKLELLKVSYCSAIGSINYLSTETLPDLSFAISSLSQYLENPGVKHWNDFFMFFFT
ncbi:hypothetical protein O181_099000 [Austropuccinia psidii MF-1]|uniref:Reverse transcriptase Ty1/copia-type domain-containing protein n=1 Tax=Austropuccinia psidii MF-1 TaxID=1389203 RepID=A0A9Q3JCR7_9BASI|nr:hypothetical protein [Austropuccinia psidii MF-1]